MNKPIITEIGLGNFTPGTFDQGCSVEVNLTARVYDGSAVKVWNEVHAHSGKALYDPNFGSKILNAIAPHPTVERIIFNDRATIVFWDDGEKTVVKCRQCEHCLYDRKPEDFDEGEALLAMTQSVVCCTKFFDYEKAVMAAMLKRLYKNFQDPIRKAFEEVNRDEQEEN